MNKAFEALVFFIGSGFLWLMIFAIPTGPKSNLLVSVEKFLGIDVCHTRTFPTTQRTKSPTENGKIQPEKVIDALKQSFGPR